MSRNRHSKASKRNANKSKVGPEAAALTTTMANSTGTSYTESSYDLGGLPEGCIAHVLQFTGPRDTCRLALVSSLFKSASESDAVWEKFLPGDLDSVLDASLLSLSKKYLFLHLSQNPILLDDKLSFWLEKRTGKKCFMLSAKGLDIIWGDTPRYWAWIHDPQSRFGEVAELLSVCWLEVRGRINTSMLSQNTMYKVYLVYKTSRRSYGFDYQSVEVNVGVNGNDSGKQSVYLDPDRGRRQFNQIIRRRVGLFHTSRIFGFHVSSPPTENENGSGNEDDNCRRPKERGDGWLEMEMGDFFNRGEEDGELEMSVLEVNGGHWKGGLIVQGIEIRSVDDK